MDNKDQNRKTQMSVNYKCQNKIENLDKKK